MRFIGMILLMVVFAVSTQAQEQPAKPESPAPPVVVEELKIKKKIPIRFQLGLNAPLLLGRVISSDPEQQGQPNPYLLTGKFLVGKIGLRAGIGGYLDKSVQREGMFADSETIENMGIDARFGLEYQHPFSARWTGTFGADWILFSSKDRLVVDSGFDVVTTGTQTSGWGLGPVIGLQFNITKRLSLLTEGAFYYTQSEGQTSRLFQNFPEFDDELGSVESTSLRYNLPVTFFIVYDF